MDALQEALLGELAEVAADRVFGQAELPAEDLGDDLPIPAQHLLDVAFALTGQHLREILHEIS